MAAKQLSLENSTATHLRIGQESANAVAQKVSSLHVRYVRNHPARAAKPRR